MSDDDEIRSDVRTTRDAVIKMQVQLENHMETTEKRLGAGSNNFEKLDNRIDSLETRVNRAMGAAAVVWAVLSAWLIYFFRKVGG